MENHMGKSVPYITTGTPAIFPVVREGPFHVVKGPVLHDKRAPFTDRKGPFYNAFIISMLRGGEIAVPLYYINKVWKGMGKCYFHSFLSRYDSTAFSTLSGRLQKKSMPVRASNSSMVIM